MEYVILKGPMIDDTIDYLNSLWCQKCHIEKLPLPASFPKIENPLNWALAIARDDPTLISTAMGSVLKDAPDEDAMVYISRSGDANQKMRNTLVDGVRSGAPVQLQVNGLNKIFDPLDLFLKTSFESFLNRTHPFGYQLVSSLWITGPNHVYNLHCDLGNHILIQLSGTKKIRFFGPRNDFDKNTFFNFDFRNDPQRFMGDDLHLELTPGEMVYFSKGIMHEVSVPEQASRSVSISISLDHLYPLMTMIDLINTYHHGQIKIQDKYTAWDKFSAYLFDPNKLLGYLNTEIMPTSLKNGIKKFMLSFQGTDLELENSLNAWWSTYSKGFQYSPTGLLPKKPENKKQILKKWEEERLANQLTRK